MLVGGVISKVPPMLLTELPPLLVLGFEPSLLNVGSILTRGDVVQTLSGLRYYPSVIHLREPCSCRDDGYACLEANALSIEVIVTKSIHDASLFVF